MILDGTATLELWHRERRGRPRRRRCAQATSSRGRRASRVSHSFRAGPDGVTMLTTARGSETTSCWYPRSQKIFWRGVGVMGRVEQFEYFDGEPVEDD